MRNARIGMTWLAVSLLAVVATAGEPKLEMVEETEAGTNGEPLDNKVSYVIGIQMGTQAKRAPIQVNEEQLVQGLRDALSGKQPRMSPQQMQAVMMQFQQQMQAKQQAAAAENQAKADTYLAENKKKEGVKVTDSGLQYEVLKAGTGDSPAAEDTVTVHYRGTLLDGKEFDSSYKRGKPISFSLKGVIPGWTEGVQLMKEGAKYRFVIPADLAYGARGRPPVIPPNATLVFEIELLEVGEPAPEEKKE